LSLGISGTGPLVQLGVMREYLPALRARLVVWFIYEGNDLDDLTSEGEDPFLLRYLDAGFRQGLDTLTPAVDTGLARFLTAARRDVETESPLAKFRTAVPIPFVRTLLGIPPIRAPRARADTLYPVVVRAARVTVERAGARLVAVILPGRARFARRDWSDSTLFGRALILRTLGAAGVPVVDLIPEFERLPKPTDLWWYARSHFTPEGYAFVARVVVDRLADGASGASALPPKHR
jgi:hypothetical protein